MGHTQFFSEGSSPIELSLQPPCECLCSASCWGLLTQLWQNGVLTHTASLQISEIDIQLYQPPCCLLSSDSVTLIYVTPRFQVSSNPCWAPLALGKGEVGSWFTLLFCCRVEVEAQLSTGSLRRRTDIGVSRILLVLPHCVIAIMTVEAQFFTVPY